MTKIMEDILKLSTSERILLMEAIWDSISEKDKSVELTSETVQILEERLEAYKRSPDEGSSWNDVKERIEKQL